MNSIIPKNGLKDWAAVTFVLGPNGQTVLILDQGKKSPRWKLPGGKRSGDESPQETAQRELKEETGIDVDLENLFLHKEIDKKIHSSPHTMFVFVADVDNFDGLLRIGDEGEYVAQFDLDRIPTMRDFFPHHLLHIKDLFAQAK
ncbi:MAG: NUDIX hydrolase [Candidatus Yonathbacteria bacterium]|nr:NUDIX hydrolase [Candidatus Yonathbacteria bacterium]